MNTFSRADILLPNTGTMEQWAVIACDQFTSDAAYWGRVRTAVGAAPSTLHMIVPEAALDGLNDGGIAAINAYMRTTLESGCYTCYPGAYVYVERTLENGSVRPGILGAVDLECYDYRTGAQSPIRATEKTVIQRLPPRVRVRRDAELEFPHVLMLCDDERRQLIEPLCGMRDSFQKLYDFDLMEGGGRIRGWLLPECAADAFDRRFQEYTSRCCEKNADIPGGRVLLAVGDGNHSLAAAKRCWEEWKAANPGCDPTGHPARYALVELVNIHDEALCFEPIHRTVTGTDPEKLLSDLRSVCAADGYPITCIIGGKRIHITLDRGCGELAVAVLQDFLDRWLTEHPGIVDYIHGEAEVERLAAQADTVGFLLPPMEKSSLFRGIIRGGVLPRKTFSMGHAREKRYYLEGRRIK